MKSDLDHLPEHKQRELARMVEILHEEFDDALALGTTEWKKRGRILKVILFGSYARGNWVDEPHTMKGYKSDFDLLIVVNNRKLTDFATYWYKAKDRLRRDRGIKTPVSFIVHSRREVNDALHKGQYFFSDIRREGIILYELDDEPLTEPKQLTPKERYASSSEHFAAWFKSLGAFFRGYRYALQDRDLNKSAFDLHQLVERSYHCVLLTLTTYSPPTHDLDELRGLSEDLDRRLVEAWPRDMQRYRAWFNKLCEAYVKARYSTHYTISEESLLWLGERAEQLQALVAIVCQEHLARLRAEGEGT
jgi:hypothetical protein